MMLFLTHAVGPNIFDKIVGLAQSIVTLCVLVSWMHTIYKTASKPVENWKDKLDERMAKDEERIGKIEQRMEDAEKNINSDNSRVADLEDSMNVTLQSLLAITDHLIDGTDKEKLLKSRDNLDEFLVNRQKNKNNI